MLQFGSKHVCIEDVHIFKHCREMTLFLLWIGTYCISCVVQQTSGVKDLSSLVRDDDSSLAAIRHVQSIIPIVRPRPNIRSHSVLLNLQWFRVLGASFSRFRGLRFRVLGASFSRFWGLRFRSRVLRFRSRGLRFRVLGASCFGLRFLVLRFRNYPSNTASSTNHSQAVKPSVPKACRTWNYTSVCDCY